MLPKNILFNKLNESFFLDEYKDINNLYNLNNTNKQLYNKPINKRIDDSDDSDNDEYIGLEEEYNELQKTMEEIFELNKLKSLSTYSESNYEEIGDSKYEVNDYKTSKKYIYDIEKLTNTNLEDYLKVKNYPKKINICPYQINNSGLKPFLQFFLKKMNNKIDFISYEGFYDYYSIINKCYKILEVLFLSYMKVSYYEYKGFIEKDDELYIFFDCTNSKIGIHSLNKNNDIWLVLVDEIINSSKVCDYEMEEKLLDFFNNNINLLYLKDENNMNYEIPMIGYTCKYDEQINFVSIFGESRNYNIVDALLGSYFYFTSYENAIENIKREKENKKKNGIIRFALFMGNMKTPLNLKDDPVDESEKTRDLLLKDSSSSTKEYRKIRDLLKVSDRDGNWSEKYDSVCICNFNLDNAIFYNLPYFVIKTYEQQTPLTYHIINK